MGETGQQAMRVLHMRRPVARGVSIARMTHEGQGMETAMPVPGDNAFSVIVQLRRFRSHRLWRDGRLLYSGGYEAGALAITDLRDRWQCHHLSAFDNLRLNVPFASLRDFTDEEGRAAISGFRSPAGAIDPVAFHLAQALLPSLQRPDEANGLFVDQICQAMLTHLAQAWGGQPVTGERKGILAPWQERRARDYLAAHISRDISLADLARECNLSRGYFIRAFRATFGITPWRWLQEHRVERARAMLRGNQPIAEIAASCGFSDQSHMTRVFTSISGITPGLWRRLNRPGNGPDRNSP